MSSRDTLLKMLTNGLDRKKVALVREAYVNQNTRMAGMNAAWRARIEADGRPVFPVMIAGARPCNCLGPQPGMPRCPCAMRHLVKRDGRWIQPEVDLGPAV